MEIWLIIVLAIIGVLFILPFLVDLFTNRLEATRYVALLLTVKFIGFFRKDRHKNQIPYCDQPYTREACPHETRETVTYAGKDHLRVACWIHKTYPVSCEHKHCLCMQMQNNFNSQIVTNHSK